MDTEKKTNLFYMLVFFFVMLPGSILTSVVFLAGIHWLFRHVR